MFDKDTIIENLRNKKIHPDDVPNLFYNDKDVIKTMIDIYPEYISVASDDLKQDLEIVLYALKKDGYVLNSLSDNIRDNFDIVKCAVKSNGLALQFASERLRDNLDIVLIALKEYDTYKYVSDRLKRNKEVIIKALESGDNISDEIPEDIKNNIELMKEIDKYIYKEDDE